MKKILYSYSTIKEEVLKLKTLVEIKKLMELHYIDFNGQKIIGIFEQLEELFLALDEYLYDESIMTNQL